jgi:hypothetical protein
MVTGLLDQPLVPTFNARPPVVQVPRRKADELPKFSLPTVIPLERQSYSMPASANRSTPAPAMTIPSPQPVVVTRQSQKSCPSLKMTVPHSLEQPIDRNGDGEATSKVETAIEVLMRLHQEAGSTIESQRHAITELKMKYIHLCILRLIHVLYVICWVYRLVTHDCFGPMVAQLRDSAALLALMEGRISKIQALSI